MATWKDHPYYHRGYLYLHNPSTIFAARVNQASFTYPLTTVTFGTVTTGAYTDILAGMTVLFGSAEGGDNLGRQRVKSATSSVLTIGESSNGTHDGEVNLGDGAYITVINDRRVWAVLPRITANGTTYKDYNTAYTVGNPPPPKANAGVGYAGFIDSGTNLITVDFDGSGSMALANGATISTYAWATVPCRRP